ncbi:hypothetical protein WJX84_012328 [Apatococcus fuscideae]|uniref:Putative GTP diphosphokinase RSH1, chloroplastic n=1 Tax=Apatococcus fuscideae TaxID=2026836 RepID=A0AAW1TG68_9CHLO
MGQGHSSTVPPVSVGQPLPTHGADTGGSASAWSTRAAKRQLRKERRLRYLRNLPARPDLSATCSASYDGSSPLQWDTGNPGSSTRRHKRQRSNVCTWSTLEAVDYSFYTQLPSPVINEDFLWRRLEPLLHYLPSQQRQQVHEALCLAFSVHSGQLRKSGEPYITHPVEVTRLLAELRSDHESLIAGLLHDTVEDTTAISFQEIEQRYGPGVRRIVEGETKFSKIGNIEGGRSKADLKALDLQQLFLAMTEEVRIIVVKLADRLHNMRTLGSMAPEKQQKIAAETLQVFAPLARMLGLYSFKQELEELSFRYLQPEVYKNMVKRLAILKKEQQPVVSQAQSAIRDRIQEDQYLGDHTNSFNIEPHQKPVWSLYRKICEKNPTGPNLNDVSDAAQLLLVLDPCKDGAQRQSSSDAQLCYHVLGLVHEIWVPIPQTVKDYIATPKLNGYQALHTSVLPLGTSDLFPLEVIIRTAEMHRIAEYGIAGEGWISSSSASSANVPSPGPTLGLPVPTVLPGMQSRMSTENFGRLFSSLPQLNGSGFANAVTRLGALNGLALNGTPAPRGAAQPQVNGISFAANGHSVMQAGEAASLKLAPQVLTRRINWLNSIREWQQEFLGNLTPGEFVNCVMDDLLGRSVFVFTPAGQVMRLSRGATVVDFAYHVHTDIGNQMVAAKVNGKVVSPSHVLSNAEVVQIVSYKRRVTNGDIVRHKEWAQFAMTRTARHKLLKFLKDNPEKPREPSNAQAVPAVTAPDLSAVIASHGHDIKTYSGSGDDSVNSCYMNFQLRGSPEHAPAMCEAIGRIHMVQNWALSCSAALPGQEMA